MKILSSVFFSKVILNHSVISWCIIKIFRKRNFQAWTFAEFFSNVSFNWFTSSSINRAKIWISMSIIVYIMSQEDIPTIANSNSGACMAIKVIWQTNAVSSIPGMYIESNGTHWFSTTYMYNGYGKNDTAAPT